MTDNVRKIFDLLGVEPNEKFKLEGRDNNLFCLTENMTGYVFDKREKNQECVSDWLLRYLLINPERIIKLPKESTKKKLRDLSEKEWFEWKDRNCSSDNYCSKCIFDNIYCNKANSKGWIYHKDLYSDKFLDQEIEVEDD